MIPASAGLISHLAQTTTTLCTIWKVTLSDGTVLGFTDLSSDVVYGGLTYVSALGYNATAVESSADLTVDNLELLGSIDPSVITDIDLRSGRWDDAALEISQLNYTDLTQGALLLRKGTLGQIQQGRRQFQAELRGLSQTLTQKRGRVVMPSCDADLGDARCKVDLTTFPRGTVAGTLTSVASRRVFADAGLTDVTGWFTGGKITFTSGANSGRAREVKTYLQSGGAITVQEPFPFALAVADAYTITAGCLKRYVTDCGTKFDNQVNFRGFPHLPGLDRLISGQ